MISKTDFKNPDSRFAPYCFFFLKGEFNSENMESMRKILEEKGFSIGYLQDRGITDNKFLSGGWFETVRKTAEKASLPFGLCDEQGGMYGGMCMDKNIPKAVSLSVERKEIEGEYTVPDCFFAVSFSLKDWKIDNSTMRLLYPGESEKENGVIYQFGKYHKRSMSGSDIDYLNSETADIIIKEVYEKIKNHLSDYFGNKITGMFMDIEGDFGYKLAYSDSMRGKYRELFDDDMLINMPLLFEEDIDGKWVCARYRWHTVAAKTYAGFFAKISDWCKNNNIEFTGHTWEENLYGQVMQEGDFYDVEKNFSIIGTDSLRLECYSQREFAEAKTVSHMENKRLMCEALGCAGNALSPQEFKRSVNCLTAWGVSHIILHGVYLTRDIEQMGFMPDMCDKNPYWDGFDKISDYMKRTSYITSETKICADTVLLNPIDSVKALIGDCVLDDKNEFSGYIIEQRDMLKCAHGLEIKEIEDSYSSAIKELTEKHIEFLVYDAQYMLSSDFDGIKNIVIPTMPIISRRVLEKIRTLSEKGINIYFIGRTPFASIENGINDDLRDMLYAIKNVKSEIDIESCIRLESAGFDFISSHRIDGNRHYFWIYNNTAKKQNAVYKIKGIKGKVKKVNCESGEISEIYRIEETDGTKMFIDFEPYEAFYAEIDEKREFVPQKWNITHNGTTFLSDKLQDWVNYKIDNFSGYVSYEFEFETDFPTHTELIIEEAYHVVKLYVNDKYVDIKLWQPYSFDITDFVVTGKNKIRIECGNLFSNSLKHYKDKTRWQTAIHRTNPIDSYKSGIYGEVKVVMF